MTEYRSILIKVTLCREGGEGLMEMVAWKRAESTLYLSSTVNRSSSTEYSWPSVCGSSVASWTSASFNGWHMPRGSRKVSVSFNRALNGKVFFRYFQGVLMQNEQNPISYLPGHIIHTTGLQPYPSIEAGAKLQAENRHEDKGNIMGTLRRVKLRLPND